MIKAEAGRLVKVAMLGLALCICTEALSQIRYEARIDESAKKLWSDESSRILCSLKAEIPDYGYVEFQSLSGNHIKTSMSVHPKLGITQNSIMRFVSARPEWQSGGKEKLLGKIRLYESYAPYAGPTLAWKVMNALAQGRQIYMPYTSTVVASDQNIVPSLSPLGFKTHYSNFLNCQQQLLKVSFNDIQLQPVVFKFQKNELTGRSLDALTNLLSYVKEDKSISSVTIRAFSYDMKDKDECISMAKERADLLKKYFKDAGFDEKAVNVVLFNAMTAQNVDEALEPDTSPEARNGIIELIRDERSGSRIDDLDLPDVGAGSNE